ncbi:Putative FAD-binding domain, FAD/NAD(P)-binding domain superfamily [Colletotrichum destructivum]|uniref:FAD-binding domain, FAD/NAD(P)-binding domain superfamily n=1 Tax=Colletotrichum destructivum TaxID=34406 RepID=A0AAX4IIM1_9PEZI|nr:Putative FAD-binding domain, FAD/NAD(P)-binding domain superfamily [Colletotrichum destructivum]
MDSIPSHRSKLVRQPAAGSASTSPDDAYEVVQHPQSKLLELTTRMLHLSALPDDSLDRSDTHSQEPSCVRWLLSRAVLEHIPGDGSIACSALATSAGVPEQQLSDVVDAAVLCGFLREPAAGHVAHTRSSASLVFCKSFLGWLRGTSSVPMPILLEVLNATLTGETGDTGDGNKPATSNMALGATGSFSNGVSHDGSLTAASSDDPTKVATTLPHKSQKPPAERFAGISSQVQSPLALATDERPVLIIGAGISGLCLAQALRKVGIPFRVFERDSAIDSRPQGYRLKLRQDAEVALAESLPKDVYQHFLASCAILAVGETDFNPFTGEVTKSRAGGGLSGKLGLSPSHTVDRTVFRSILMTGIEDRVFFSRQLASYTANEDQGGGGGGGGVVVTFTDGERTEGRFLVGADGLHSIVRPGLLPEHKIKDTGAACVYGKTPLTPELAARFPEKGLRWMTVVADQAPMLQSFHIGDAPATLLTEPTRFSEESRSRYRLPQDYVYWVLIAPQARFGAGGGLTSPPPKAGNNIGGPNQQQQQAAAAAEAAARLSLAVTEEWHPSLRSVFELQDTRQATFVPIISSVPDIPAWEPSAVVTLLGDAIHPMSPCGGVGAQTAICDAAALAKVLDEARGSPSAGDVGRFEEGMRRRARGSIVQSEIGSKTMFGLGSLEECKPWASN